jgi:hypothetical protein
MDDAMEKAIEREFDKLLTVVDKYCLKGKEDTAIGCVEWARGYATDYPGQSDINEAIRLVKKVGKYVLKKGKPDFKQARDRIIKKLLEIPLEKEVN